MILVLLTTSSKFLIVESTALMLEKAGEANLVIAGGTESMSGAGFILPGAIRGGHKMADLTMKDHMILDALTDAYHNINCIINIYSKFSTHCHYKSKSYCNTWSS